MEQEAKHSHTHWHRVEIREARSLRGEKRDLGCYQKCSFAYYPASTRCGNGCVTRYSFVTRSLSSRVKGLNTSCWLFRKDMRHNTQASTLSIWMKSVSWNLSRKLFRTWDDSRTDVSSFRSYARDYVASNADCVTSEWRAFLKGPLICVGGYNCRDYGHCNGS